MTKNTLFIAVICCLLVACGKSPLPRQHDDAISTRQNLPGDSTIYGLACEGCTDSILILLPYAGGDPDTFNIIRAFEERRIYGRPHIGDDLAVILQSDSTKEVRMTINVSTLLGQWNYMVTPTLRHPDKPMPPLPDSIRKRIMAPREYGIRIRNGGTAFSIGGYRYSSGDMSPVIYPSLKRYHSWRLYNGQLILLADSFSKQQPDTVAIQLLRRDSLILRFSDHEQSYYRKKEAQDNNQNGNTETNSAVPSKN